MKYSIERLEGYLRETLHTPTHLEPWGEESTLPAYLRGQYRFFEGTIGNVRALFLQADDAPAPSVAKKHERVLQQQWHGPVAFAFDRITPRSRQRMIQEGLAFVVLGNQIYLPTLGMDLQERYRKRTVGANRLRPSAQVLLLSALSGQAPVEHTPTGFARILGYTPMAIGQALDQLEQADLVQVRKAGRERIFDLAGAPEAVWEKAQPLLATPVRRSLYVAGEVGQVGWGLSSGLSALAAYSLLAEPSVPVVALAAPESKTLLAAPGALELPSAEEADLAVEVWTYPPRLLSDGPTVDRLSLYLSLKNDEDERVQSALDEMMRGITW